MISNEAEAKKYVASLCSDEDFEKLEQYVSMLRDENRHQNLVAHRSLDNVWHRHIADSAQLVRYVPRETQVVLDLGSGAGLPGLIWTMIRPNDQVILVESRRRRIEWLQRVTNLLALTNCQIFGERLENMETFHAEVITARAFAPLPQLVALAERFSTKGTTWVLPKGRSAAQERQKLPARVRSLFHVEQSLTDQNAGILIGKSPPE
ncbi:16S rRNA (guanine(527)-N(7))-methyltransferase RsmG [Qipengyuania atrilutea]|uniref:Ribosomal RNA small subunit methyltransferase G n=1 Tax=Qipengyuania atrilutea TaxID=2744473 RepID=A0A850GXX7_9SPHN|nr:16S rRNA (guanine(527)-N(7))-methyltransferase RsmG [Actirhodobacter atriluteus]NVD44454.1 16S rRNA (guanine(527)-N(7))-methyltransferase RsmG [Actirhodobacter atriluteus]